MSHFLVATMPEPGHVHPAVPVVTALLARGHRVTWHSGPEAETVIRNTGAQFVRWRHTIGFDELPLAPDPGTRGGAALVSALRNHVLDRMPGQLADYEAIALADPVDAVLVDACSFGARALHERHGVPWATLGTTPFYAMSPDTPLYGTGRPPPAGPFGRLYCRLANRVVRFVMREATDLYARQRAALGLPRLPAGTSPLDHMISDQLHLQASTPLIEYPRRPWPSHVHFAGPLLPAAPAEAALPPWWPELAWARVVVHVTQGTVTDHPVVLIEPALRALAGLDGLVVVTTRDPGELVGVPANARVERYIPHSLLLPHVDVMITNGGFNGTKAALAHGVPVVIAPAGHDKPDVAARVGWAGAGIDLRTVGPTESAIATAVRTVLTDGSYRAAARRIQAEFRRYPDGDVAAALLERLATGRLADPVRPGRAG
ncbi:MAG TPA: nucleotide disphospho-sugar-binding domain-containing protein [Actinophytocola sp.]|jgi:UDP:flavonoid glycosyltransferase YjiC (YdhE family)|uniref:glycosyltransferase n=1 Tax=Actinophytocola sp. TaxID=1872138 RepID=UPI002E055B1F|nr:nucleotide disphospho-sugar-binding domain-containing protein [Actinophytocola sp.]